MIASEGSSVQWRVLLRVHRVTSSASHEEKVANLFISAFSGKVKERLIVVARIVDQPCVLCVSQDLGHLGSVSLAHGRKQRSQGTRHVFTTLTNEHVTSA